MHASLSRVVEDSFSFGEFRVLVSGLHDGPEAIKNLPLSAESWHVAAFEALQALKRMNLVDADFVLALVRARPRRILEIRAAALAAHIDIPTEDYITALVAVESKRHAIELILALPELASPMSDASVLTLALLHSLPETGMQAAWMRVSAKLRMLDRPEPAAPPVFQASSRERAVYLDIREILAMRGDASHAARRLLDLAQICHVKQSVLTQCIALKRTIDACRRTAIDNLVDPLVDLLATSARIVDHGLQAASTAPLAPPAAADALPVVQGEGLRKSYASKDFELQIESIAVHAGQILGVVGPNGAGKSSLLRLLSGNLARSAGALVFPALGVESSAGTVDWVAVKGKIRYVAQRPRPWNGPLDDNLRAWATLFDLLGAENERVVEYLIDRLGLTPHRHKSWAELSAGFRVRFEIARALLGQPRLLVLDEPLALLDTRAQLLVLQDLRELIGAVTSRPAVILSSQHIHEIEPFVHQLLFLNESGRVVFYGAPSEIGERSTSRVFELARPLSLAICDEIRARCPECRFYAQGGVILLEVPMTHAAQELLALLPWGAEVSYVREITGSAMRLMREV